MCFVLVGGGVPCTLCFACRTILTALWVANFISAELRVNNHFVGKHRCLLTGACSSVLFYSVGEVIGLICYRLQFTLKGVLENSWNPFEFSGGLLGGRSKHLMNVYENMRFNFYVTFKMQFIMNLYDFWERAVAFMFVSQSSVILRTCPVQLLPRRRCTGHLRRLTGTSHARRMT